MNSWTCTFVREVRVLEADSCTICWGVCLSEAEGELNQIYGSVDGD